jgi:hypothetical protein
MLNDAREHMPDLCLARATNKQTNRQTKISFLTLKINLTKRNARAGRRLPDGRLPA